jgi:hypothetical protein
VVRIPSRPIALILPLLLFPFAAASRAAAADVPKSGSPAALSLPATAAAPRIDGRLEPGEWPADALQIGEWLSYNPLHGDRLAQTTTVWATYDKRFL